MCTIVVNFTTCDLAFNLGDWFMSLRGKGSTLGKSQAGVKFTLVFLVLQPRSATFEGYNPLVGALGTSANLLPPFVPLKKPLEVARCACIAAQLQLERCSHQGCKILAAA